jgi:hypothetical protein
MLIIGVKGPSFANVIFTILNLGVIAFIFIAGAFNADLSNWNKTVYV